MYMQMLKENNARYLVCRVKPAYSRVNLTFTAGGRGVEGIYTLAQEIRRPGKSLADEISVQICVLSRKGVSLLTDSLVIYLFSPKKSCY